MDDNELDNRQQDDTPPDKPNDEDNSPPNGGSNSSSSVTWSGATEITSGGSHSNETYTSTTANQNALLIDTSASVTLTNPTVTKRGNGDASDNSSFYGVNAGVMVKGGTKTTISGGTVNTSAPGANGVFSYGGNGGQNGSSGDGTTVTISNTTINTTGDGSGGIMTTGGGITKANNLTVTTTGQSSAPIRSDRGGGSVTVSGGSYTSSGLGSPAIYSTATITVENATLTSNKSEGVCIEGQNSVALTNCTLNANNTATNGNAQFLDGVILYQSMSGDSSTGTATFSMTGGTINNSSGHVFHVTNTNAVINLNNVTINNASGVLLSVCDDGWSGASNVATINASGQTLVGDILVGDDSSLTLNLSNGSTLTGNIGGSITNASGSVISSNVGAVDVVLDASSKWYLSGDAYISGFSGDASNIITNGFNVYVNNSVLGGTTTMDETISTATATETTGVILSADGTTLTATASLTGNVVDLRAYPTAAVADFASAPSAISGGLVAIGNSNSNSLRGSADNVNIMTGYAGNNTLTFGSDYTDFVYYSGTGNDIVTDFTSSLDGDRVIVDTTLENVVRSGAAVALGATNGNILFLQTDSSDGTIYYSTDFETAKTAQIADFNQDTIAYSGEINYFALGQDGTLIVTGEDDNTIALDGSEGQEFFQVVAVDASGTTGNNAILGDEKSNVLIGGSGVNVLWGGTGTASDVLIGTGGLNLFLLGKNDGNDYIQNAGHEDTVHLYDVTLSDIVAFAEENNTVAIQFNTGNIISVNSSDSLSATFNLADGSAYQYNHATKSWQTA